MKRIVIWICVLVIVCFGAYSAVDSVVEIIPESPIKDVVVNTDGVLHKNRIMSIIGFEYGMELSDSSVAEATTQLKALPEIKTVTIEQASFGTIIITIEEHSPLASLYDGEWKYLLETGDVVTADLYHRGVLPIITQKEHAPIMLHMLKQIKRSNRSLYDSLSEITWNAKLSAGVLFVLGKSQRILVGKDTDYRTLAHKYRLIQDEQLTSELTENIIDMRFADFAYLR
ncbi:MAG: FtsQ-type POTRA domain-containing protein [Fibrobacterales bacterium]